MKKLTRQEILMTIGTVLLPIALIVILSGCDENQRSGKWGQGDPPAVWQGWFGNDNNSRLDFVQQRAIEQQGDIILGLDVKDQRGQPVRTEGGKTIRKRGLIEKIAALEKLNAEQHKIMGETDIRFHERIKKLEEAQPETVSEIPRVLNTEVDNAAEEKGAEVE